MPKSGGDKENDKNSEHNHSDFSPRNYLHILYHSLRLDKQIRWWKLKKKEARAEYQSSVTTKLDAIGLDLDWNKIQEILVSTAKEKL